MNTTLTILILLVTTFTSYTQPEKLLAKGTLRLLNRECSYQRDTGINGIIKDELQHKTFYRQDSIALIVTDSIGTARFRPRYTRFLVPDKDELYVNLDSVTAILFRNGLLTPQLLITVFNKPLLFLDNNGDTTITAKHTAPVTCLFILLSKPYLPLSLRYGQ